MATMSVFRHSSSSYLLFFSLLALIWKAEFSFSLLENPNFDSNIVLFGDAAVDDGGSSVQLTRPVPSSFGLLTYTKPFKFLESNPTKAPASFSTHFTFSISPQNGDGLALIIVPNDFGSKFHRKNAFGLSRENRFLGIEFDTSRDSNAGIENANCVAIDVCNLSSSRFSNISSLNLVLNSGLKLKSWVDYDASSKRLEVRLSKFGDGRPYNPLFAYQIDLSEMWQDEEVLVGLSSSNGNSLQTSSVYSWKFRVRSVPNRMHSLPVDPQIRSNQRGELKTEHKKRSCQLGVLSGFVFAVGCGAFAVFVVMLLWTIFINGHNVIPAEYSLPPPDFRYEKINLVVEKNSEDVKK